MPPVAREALCLKAVVMAPYDGYETLVLERVIGEGATWELARYERAQRTF